MGWRRWTGGALTALIIASGAAIWIGRKWPFTERAVTRDLQERVNGHLSIGHFRETWFPPGAVAGDIRVSDPSAPKGRMPEITARELILRGSWPGLLTHTIANARVIGLHIHVPDGYTTDALFVRGVKSKIREIGELELNDGSFDSESLKVRANQLILDHLGRDETVEFHGFLVTDKPHGELKGEGRAGPIHTISLSAIPVSGTFQFANADLGAFSGLRGILASKGRFDGSLARVNVSGVLDVPQFHVDGSAHSTDLEANYRAAVNTQNADTELQGVEAHVGRTTIDGVGQIGGTPGVKGKTARVRLVVNKGRVEDLLNYFSDEKQPSITGAVRLSADAELPPGPESFLRKVRVVGNFGVAGSKFTDSSKQTSINDLSASAWKKTTQQKESKEEDDARTAVSNLRGHVDLRDGTAVLSHVSFDFPGAFADMGGTFRVIPKIVDIHGTLRTTGNISESTSGFKALMLKVAKPFLKKKDTTVVPFAITGSASNPKIGLDLAHKSKY